MTTRFHLFGAETRRSTARLLAVFRSKRTAVQAAEDTAPFGLHAYFQVTRAEPTANGTAVWHTIVYRKVVRR